MTLSLKICLYILLGCCACKLSDHLWTVSEQVRGWYLTRPSFSVMGMSEGMSEAEQLDQ
jgi:hypothetical protein